MSSGFKNIIRFIACGIVSLQLHAQSYFNVLDSNGFLNFSVIENNNSYIVSSDLWSTGGSRSVALTQFDLGGNKVVTDTLNYYPVLSTGGRLLSIENEFVLTNIINDIPPFASNNRDIELGYFSTIGNEMWMNNYGGSAQDTPSSIILTNDSSILMLGTTHSVSDPNGDFYLIKTNLLGEVEWTNTLGNSQVDVATGVVQTFDRDFVISGFTFSPTSQWVVGNYDFRIIKTDSLGNEEWSKVLGTIYDDNTIFVNQLSDGTILVCGSIGTASSQLKGTLIKLDLDGNIIWEKSYLFGSYTNFYSIPIENSDGTFTISGVKKNSSGSIITFLATFDPFGDTIWTKEYFTRPDTPQYFYEIKSTSDGGFIMCGSAFPIGSNTQRAWLIKTNCNGEDGVQHPVTGTPCDQYDCTLYPINANFTSSATTIDIADGGTINFENNSANTTSRVWSFGDGNVDYTDSFMPHTFTQVGTYEVQLIVYHGMCSDTVTQTIEVINTTGIEDLLLETGMNIYPNPNQGDFTIRFKNAFEGQVNVLDLMGRNYRSIEVTKESVLYEMSNLPKGVYVVELVMKNGRREVKRMEVL